MFFIIRLAVIYLVIGAGILFAQLNNTPCQRPLVLDDGHSDIGPPIDFPRLGRDTDYAMRLGKQAVFWLPRFIDFVITGDMTVKNFIFATDCKPGTPLLAGAPPAAKK